MRSKIWLLISCLMVLSLLIASCGEASPQTPATQTSPTIPTSQTTPTAPTTTSSGQGDITASPTSKYGGTFIIVGGDPSGFDDGVTMYIMNSTCYLTNEDLLQGDWMKGPAGTNEVSWMQGIIGRMELLTGGLAESWELVGADTIIFHIRKGVHWQDKAPVNGRESPETFRNANGIPQQDLAGRAKADGI